MLAPVDPPRVLAVQGLYRYVRNPMYVSGSLILLGETLLFDARAFLAYALGWLVAVNLLVLGHEEPTLRRKFGPAYERHLREVGR